MDYKPEPSTEKMTKNVLKSYNPDIERLITVQFISNPIKAQRSRF